MAESQKSERAEWSTAWLKGLLIFGYFAISTVWWPSWLAKFDPIASLDRVLLDALVIVAWGVPLAAGIIGLRLAQRRGLL